MVDPKSKAKKPRLISLRLTEAQYQYLEDMARRVRKRTGLRVTRTSIVMKLMEYGLPHLQRDFPGSASEERTAVTKTAVSLDSDSDVG